MEDFKEKCRKLKETCFVGEVTMTKATLWMIAGLCLLAGIVRGLRMAPMTHGIMIGCGNGNGNDREADAGEPEQAAEEEGCGCRRAGKGRKEKGLR